VASLHFDAHLQTICKYCSDNITNVETSWLSLLLLNLKNFLFLCWHHGFIADFFYGGVAGIEQPQLHDYFVSAAVAVDSSHMTALSSASWSRFSPPSNFVNGHVSTMSFMVCRWPPSQEGDWARPHLCKLARHGPWPARKRFIGDHVWRGRSKPGCWIVLL